MCNNRCNCKSAYIVIEREPLQREYRTAAIQRNAIPSLVMRKCKKLDQPRTRHKRGAPVRPNSDRLPTDPGIFKRKQIEKRKTQYFSVPDKTYFNNPLSTGRSFINYRQTHCKSGQDSFSSESKLSPFL